MKTLKDNSVDLTITSPPYDELRDYDGFSVNINEISSQPSTKKYIYRISFQFFIYSMSMRVLELFSGTGSVGKICKEKGYEVVSLDLKGADINTDILKWDYTTYPAKHFDIIWASPPCDTFSNLRKCWYGRKMKCHNGAIFTKELELQDRERTGLPILRQTQAIIDYFKPALWFIENPKTGSMKDYLTLPFYDVDYCKYSDWGYKKPTRI
jgi:hypothetical protein